MITFMHKIVFVTGASGSGKTTLLQDLEQRHMFHAQFCYFDSIGVPSTEAMEEEYGSGEEWQRQTTIQWVKDIKSTYLTDVDVILDGQMRLGFILEACKRYDIENFDIILLDCSDSERMRRLVDRGQPELANKTMMSWATFLRNEVQHTNKAVVLDTTNKSLKDSTQSLLELIDL
jgi:dephospho-CoA kinase